MQIGDEFGAQGVEPLRARHSDLRNARLRGFNRDSGCVAQRLFTAFLGSDMWEEEQEL